MVESIRMVFTTEGFLKVVIESWPEWDLNPRTLNSVQNPKIFVFSWATRVRFVY